MPQPPAPFDPDLLFGLKFVTNYFWAGCSPRNLLVIDTNTQPEKDLALLFLTPDISDIVQEIFDPRGGRKRRPNRHGRKPPGGRGSLDVSTLIGRYMRSAVNPANALRFSPTRYAFPVINIFEGVFFAAAVVDGLTDIGFDNLWGVLNLDPSQCVDIDRLHRYRLSNGIGGGIGGQVQPINLGNVLTIQGFTNGNFGTSINKEYSLSFQCGVTANQSGPVNVRAVIVDGGSNVLHWGDTVSLGEGDSGFLSVSGDLNAGQFSGWAIENMSGGFYEYFGAQCAAFTHSDWPWPWNK